METIAEKWKKEGKKEGMEAKAKETAKRMLEDGLPIETIAKYTGLTEKKVKALMS
jgi:predicted transposase/invertase (TIGR01784 family)